MKALTIFLACIVPALSGSIQLIQSARDTGDLLTRQADLEWTKNFASSSSINFDSNAPKQKIFGFGGAFTDAASYNFFLMNEQQRQQVLEAYWGENGIGYTVGRVPISSCDFTRFTYSFDEVDQDFNLDQFDNDVTQDTEVIIPFIKAALNKSKKQVRLFASPWSPPSWMKIPHPGQAGQGMNGSASPLGLIQDPNYFKSWALYYIKWFQAYKAHGLNFWGLTVQNEPQALQTFESCLYTKEAERDFVRDYLGPMLKSAFPNIKIMAWDHNKYPSNTGGSDRIMTEWVQTMYQDPSMWQYIDGIAFHWYQVFEGFGFQFDQVNKSHYMMPPDKFLLNTEACWCGPSPQVGDWSHGEWYGVDIIGDLNNWSVGWIDWNLLLDIQGGPNHVQNYCQAPFIYDPTSKQLTTLPQFYYIAQISKYIPPESTIVNTVTVDPSGTDPLGSISAVTAITPEGKTVVVVINPTDDTKTSKLNDLVNSRYAALSIPAHSIQTYIFV